MFELFNFSTACTLHANETAVYVPGKDPSSGGILSPVHYDIANR